ncbi:tetratricopeptide repeat protein [candidate division KSB1 bacterium]|nr:tetratricopeptide repeat protein [candidate division KSB1 bacterium]
MMQKNRFRRRVLRKMVSSGLLFLMLALMSQCAVNRYAKAELYLNEKQYDRALGEYMSIIKANRHRGMKKNTRAYVGAAISYHNLGEFKKCMNLCRKVLKVDPNNGAALYYLGNSLENLGMEQLAMSCYKRYPQVSKESPYHSFLKARMNILIHKGQQ